MWYRKDQKTPATINRAAARDDFFSLVDDLFKDWSVAPTFSQKLSPLMNIAETDNSYRIEAELPGVDKKDVSIEIHDNVLTVKGEKKGFNEEKKEQYHRVERSHGSFVRSVGLPSDIDAEKISAKLEDGVLHIEVAKQEAKVKKRTIDIR